MGSTKLKQDLSNCLISFDRRVLITELLDIYQLAYEEVNKVVQNFVEELEKKDKLKFNKRFLVHGVWEGENKKEVFKIVEEAKLKEWLKKLKDTESTLYSVEVAGGAKAAAPVFKPMRVEEGVKLKVRQGSKATTTNGTAPETSKTVNKVIEAKTSTNKIKESPKKTVKLETSVKKASPKSETSPTDKKTSDKKCTTSKRGINNFFAPSSAASKKSEGSKDTKPSSGVIKPPTPKMGDFFKKQTEKPKAPTETLKIAAADTSVQLFGDEEEEEQEVVSSDEEEKLEALKRDIISSDVEMEEEDEADSKPSTSSKRRRILDSDEEEEDPPIKHEKLDIKDVAKEEPVVETYLDEDGFVITKKPKQKAATSKKTPTKKTSPIKTIKASPKSRKDSSNTSKDVKTGPNPAAKTKQAGIMNFFTKK